MNTQQLHGDDFWSSLAGRRSVTVASTWASSSAATSASASTSASLVQKQLLHSKSLYAAFPETMLEALRHTGPQQHAVPVLVLVPVSHMTPVASAPKGAVGISGGSRAYERASPRTSSTTQGFHSQPARMLHPALSRLLEVDDVVGAAPLTAWTMREGPSSHAWTTASIAAQASEPFSAARHGPATGNDSLPSFGERTAAAKMMVSAAPGGPVRGHPGISHSQPKKKVKKDYCPFCKKNGESSKTYSSHRLSRPDGGCIKITCPVLRNLRCELCGATGDQAHTRTHCPMSKERLSVAALLKQTQRRCDGSIRLK